jgi:hypothetical protein
MPVDPVALSPPLQQDPWSTSEIHGGAMTVLQGSGQFCPTPARRPLSSWRPSSPYPSGRNRPASLPLPYFAYVCFKCFRRFEYILHLYYMDVAKLDRRMLYMLHMLQLFQRRVASVCFKCFRGMFHSCFLDACCMCVYLDGAYVSHIRCMCFI